MVEAAVFVRKLRRLQPEASLVEDVIGGALVCAFVGFEVFVRRAVAAALRERNVPTPPGVPTATLIPLDRGTLSSRRLEMTDSKHSPDTEKSGVLKRKQSSRISRTERRQPPRQAGIRKSIRVARCGICGKKIDPVTGEIIAVIATQDSKKRTSPIRYAKPDRHTHRLELPHTRAVPHRSDHQPPMAAALE